ncbi:MAG: diadenylate cyclase CdaA [Oscillospiraceae bacterium]|nr:diadenylate cyclase CdaA [Oscillospiraceae bacterium]MBR5252186.1 diadenylate cyclase CdaA [Oscillospiraceae bacterium]
MDINNLISSVTSVVNTIEIGDILDILILTVLIYNLLMLVRKSRLAQLFKGVAVLFVVYVVSVLLGMKTIVYILNNILQFGIITIIVIFQPEVRNFLETIGKGGSFGIKALFQKKTADEVEVEEMRKTIAAICDSAKSMSETRTGALMVMEKFSNLSEIKRSGTVVNADITPELIGTIFYEGCPLHDGAMVIENNRISAAGCVLPLSDNLEISKDLGTRHRAALGLSEVSDAVIVVVSEETGIISIAKKGKFYRRLNRQTLYERLEKEFVLPVINASEKAQLKAQTKTVKENTDEKQ